MLLAPLSRNDIVALIEDAVCRADGGEPEPSRGYLFGASNGLEDDPRLVSLSVHAGDASPANFSRNSVSLRTLALNDANAAFMNVNVFKAAMLAFVRVWDPIWCCADPWGLHAFRKERTRDRGLVMTATEERFDFANAAHVAVAREIEHSLEPVNALPWPPDA
jgi:hypothetical protein